MIISTLILIPIDNKKSNNEAILKKKLMLEYKFIKK